MRTLNFFMSFLLGFAVNHIWAASVSSVSDIQEGKIYTISTNGRGAIVWNGSSTCLSTTTTLNPDSPNHQFTFVKGTGESNKFYMKNIGANQYVYQNGTDASLSSDASALWTIKASGDSNYPLMIDAASGNHWNINGSGEILIDDWDIKDEGNCFKIEEVDNTSGGSGFSGSGSGTENDPYLIFNPIQLDQVRNFLGRTNVHFKLMSDLDLTEYILDNSPTQGWQPIGTETESFKGVFDGNEKTVSGLWIKRSSTSYVGFFGRLESASIKNITINYNGDCSGSNYTGAFVGISINSFITNCSVNAINVIGGSGSGGFAGEIHSGTVSNGKVVCSSVSGTQNVGGFVGTFSYNASLNSCSAQGTVSGSETVGGFAGWGNGGSISSSSCKGNVTGNNYIGGFVGNINAWESKIATSSMTSCLAEGNVSGKNKIGGFVGKDCSEDVSNHTTTYTSCYHLGTVNGENEVGGLVGYSQSPSITNCGHDGDIAATGNYASGLVGKLYAYQTSTINNCYSVGNLTAAGNGAGGIIGEMDMSLKYYIKLHEGIKKTGSENILLYPSGTSGRYRQVRSKGAEYWVNSENYYTYKYANDVYEEGDITAYPGYIIVGITRNIDTGLGNATDYRYGYTWSSKGKFDMYDNGFHYCYAVVPYSPPAISSIANNYYNGTIVANDSVGGIIGCLKGYAESINVIKNYSNGNISGHNIVGGIIGYLTYDPYIHSTTFNLKSNVAINPELTSTEKYIGRVYGMASGSNYTIGASGTTERNYALATSKVSINGVPQTIEDNLQNGDSRGNSTLKIKATYQGIGWDFTNDWTIQDTECYPYSPSQTAPPVFSSKLTSGMTTISGNATAGSEVLVNVAGKEYKTTANGTTWSVNVPTLESGASVYACARTTGKAYSYRTSTVVSFVGSGTAADPYQIHTASDLAHINSASYYKVMNDIDLTSYINTNSPTKGWIPIGRSATVMSHLLGGGHTISGLWSNTTENYTGLFAAISDAEISDLTLVVANGKTIKGGDYAGILAGKISNGKIKNCSIKGNVSGSSVVGGFAGCITNAVLDSLDYKGNITATATQARVGGIVGDMTGQANNCVTDVSIIANGENSYLGGVAGVVIGTGTSGFENCKTTVVITSSGNTSYLGGLAGKATSGKCNNTLADAQISSTGTGCYAGGLFGYSNYEISSCCTNGSVVASGSGSYAGGLAGKSENNVTDCYSKANVNGAEYAAGLVGYSTHSVNRCYASGNLKGTKVGAGVVGYNDGTEATINNCIAVNKEIDVSSSTGVAMRVLGGYKNNDQTQLQIIMQIKICQFQ